MSSKTNPQAAKQFADNLRTRRKELGLTQEGLAEVCGLHRTEIGLLVFKYTVPFTYGAIGACIALLKVCHALIYLRQFDPRRIPEYYNRIILGAISGGMIVILIDQFTSSGSQSGVSDAALGLLAGYNSDLLFSAIERISIAVLRRVSAGSAQNDTRTPAPPGQPRNKASSRRRLASTGGPPGT